MVLVTPVNGSCEPQKNHIATCRGKATDLEDVTSVVLCNRHQILSAGPGTDMAPWLTFLGEVSYMLFPSMIFSEHFQVQLFRFE